MGPEPSFGARAINSHIGANVRTTRNGVVIAAILLLAIVPYLNSASVRRVDHPVGTVFDLGRHVTLDASIQRFGVTRGSVDDFGSGGSMRWHAEEWHSDSFSVAPSELLELLENATVIDDFVPETRPALGLPFTAGGVFDVMAAPDDTSATVAYHTPREPTGTRAYFPMGPLGGVPVECGDLRARIPDSNDCVELSLADGADESATIVAILGEHGAITIVAGARN